MSDLPVQDDQPTPREQCMQAIEDLRDQLGRGTKWDRFDFPKITAYIESLEAQLAPVAPVAEAAAPAVDGGEAAGTDAAGTSKAKASK